MYLSKADAKKKVLEEKYHGVRSAAYEADCAQIDADLPYEYLLGYADFLDCRIDLGARPMIPRDKTAFWVRRVIDEWKDKEPATALDLYAGSGNIGLALLRHLPSLHVTLSEVDAALLPGIARSLELNSIDSSRATLVAGDSLQHVNGRFDLMCANPPYLNPALESEMDPEMRYEPRVAFFGSSDGFGHHRELIERGRDYLTPRGALFIECDMTQAEELREMVAPTDWVYEFWDDEFGHPGTLVLRSA